jgi:drug/metabolite transporter (DMT)-like permease
MSSSERGREIQAEMWLLVAVVIWAANYPVSKFSIARINIFVFNGIRYLVAALVLTAFFAARQVWKPVHASDRPALLRAGLVAHVLYQVAFIIGLSMTTAGNSAVLLATSPLWTIVIHARLRRERIMPHVVTGMILSLTGIVMIVLGSGTTVGFGGEALVGDVITLTAAILWGLNTNLQRPLLSQYSTLQLALVMIIVGASGLVLIAIPPAFTMEWGSVDWLSYAAAVGSGIFSIAAGNVFWSLGVKRLGPGKTSNFSNLIPVLALVISYVMLHEHLFILQFVGASVTIAGVWLARR